jgi:transcriptional regulator with XRE-family HTH domain
MTTIGERIKDARRAQGLTQEELGERVGLNRLAVQNMERGTRKVAAEESLVLAHALGVRVGVLLGEPEPQAEPTDLRFEVSVRLLPNRSSGQSLPEMQELLELCRLVGVEVTDLMNALQSKQATAGQVVRASGE